MSILVQSYILFFRPNEYKNYMAMIHGHIYQTDRLQSTTNKSKIF